MKYSTLNQYACLNYDHPLLQHWVAKLLQLTQKERPANSESLSEAVVKVFGEQASLVVDIKNPDQVRRWLGRASGQTRQTCFDESDRFCMQTRQLADYYQLTGCALALLRFTVLLGTSGFLQRAAALPENDLNEFEASALVAELLDLNAEEVRQSMGREQALMRFSLLQTQSGEPLQMPISDWFETTRAVVNFSFSNTVYDPRPVPEDDDGHTSPEFHTPGVDTLRDYLNVCFEHGTRGANVLITGGSAQDGMQLVQQLARSLASSAIVIPQTGLLDETLEGDQRLHLLASCQNEPLTTDREMVIVNDAECIIGDCHRSTLTWGGSATQDNPRLVTALTSNTRPVVWMTVQNYGIDANCFKRFDMILQRQPPCTRQRQSVAKQYLQPHFSDLLTSLAARVAEHESITPVHLEKAARMCEHLDVSEAVAAKVVLQVLEGELVAMDDETTKLNTAKVCTVAMPYNADIFNADVDLKSLAARMATGHAARLCLYGPPGTGKTAWARQLAQTTGQPLIVKRGSDIFGRYVGESEQRLAKAFADATAAGGILLIDEADSFLQDRATLDKPWQHRFVNEFLTAMEQYEGTLVCTTNRIDSIDPAASRRFDIRIHLDYLKHQQAVAMASNLLRHLHVEPDSEVDTKLQSGLCGLSLAPGDFAMFARRYALIDEPLDVTTLIKDCQQEAQHRGGAGVRQMGFLASVG
ncbi:MAG: ATP-binding protein [Granulosicoccus sp.]